MKRQISSGYFYLGSVVAILAALWILGKYAPDSAANADDRKVREAAAKIVMPDIQGTTLDGHPFRLSDYRGKVVLVNFWATWCGPCRMEIPDLIALQKKYGPRGFTLVGLSQDDSPTPVKAFVQQQGINYPVMMEPPGTANALGITSLPTSLLIDKDGKVAYVTLGVSQDTPPREMWAPEIEKVL